MEHVFPEDDIFLNGFFTNVQLILPLSHKSLSSLSSSYKSLLLFDVTLKSFYLSYQLKFSLDVFDINEKSTFCSVIYYI